MLASGVAHASAKGRSQQSMLPKPPWALRSSPRKLFDPPPAQGGLDPVATCFIEEKNTHVMIWGEQTLRICSERLAVCVGVAAKTFTPGNQGLTSWRVPSADFPSRRRQLCYNFYKL